MEIITRYRSADGVEFADKDECHKYEVLCHEVNIVMACLAAIQKRDSCEFANGSGYIQHNVEAGTSARRKILSITNHIMPHKWFEQELAGQDVHASWAGRLIGEMNERCLRDAWYRFSCMDAGFREYGQQYYALNPSQAKDICLN